MSKKILEVKNLSVSFNTYAGEVKALRDISFSVDRGETLAIVGESGSGKSVTVQTVMRLIPMPPGEIKGGEILFEGEDLIKVSDIRMRELRGGKIGMIFQDPMTSLNPTIKVGKQIMEGILIHKKVSKAEAKKQAIEMLRKVGIPKPEERFNQYPHEFSGGMRQRAVIAIALSCEPDLLICDEPTTALDVTIQSQILELINNLKKELNIAVILITHDLGVVAETADRVVVMYAGEKLEEAPVKELFKNPKHPYTWGLLKSLPRLDMTSDEKLTSIPGTPPDLLKPPVGDPFAPRSEYAMKIDYERKPPMIDLGNDHFVKSWLYVENAPEVASPSFNEEKNSNNNSEKTQKHNEKLIEMTNLKKYFDMGKKQVLKAVDNVTMDIYKGEVLSLVGESGSGKTTLGRTISKLYNKTNGDIIFDGKPIENYNVKEFTKKVQMIFQDPQASLNPRMTVGDIIAEGIDLHNLAKNKKERNEKVYELLELVGLNREHANRFPHEFSGGQRQRIGIARALAVDPEILVCDEPISALDVSIQAQVVNLLKDLQKERNLTLLFIAHDLSMVKYISDRVAVMYRGKVVELGEPEAVYNNPIHSYTKSLISAVPVADPTFKKIDKVEMDESYLRSPMGDVSEINNIPEKSELTEYKPGHFVETAFLEENGLL